MLRRLPLLIPCLVACLGASTPAQAAPVKPGPEAGDVNGDGRADVVVTDFDDSIDSEGASVIFGTADRAPVSDYAKPGGRGFRITGRDSVSFAEIAGDTNGDGLADILVATNGPVFIVYGRTSTAPVDLQHLGTGGRALRNVSDNQLAVLGDVSGDGLGDIAQASGGDHEIIRIWLGGRAAPFTRKVDVVATGRLRKVGPNTPSAGVGDLNGDGINDIAITLKDPDGRTEGLDTEDAVFVVDGSRSLKTVTLGQRRRGAAITVRRAGAPAGRAIRHDRSTCTCSVYATTPAGDLNGDGRGDMAIVMEAWKIGTNRVDIVYGSKAGTTVTLPGKGGAVVTGTTFATEPIALGDVTGDGRDDLLVVGGRDKAYHLVDGKKVRPTASTATLPVALRGRQFGHVAAAGDVDGDGLPDERYSVFSLEGYAAWGILYGSSPLPVIDLAQPSPQTASIARM